jgi:hypothetical protein
MRSWHRFLWAILDLSLIIFLDATPGPGANRRLAVVVAWTLRALFFIAFVAGFFWLVEPLLRVRERVGLWLALVVFGILGAFLELVALAVFLRVAVLLWRGRRTTATVVSDTSPFDDPKFQFSDPSGQAHLVSGPVSSVRRAYGAGQRVPLIYLPGRPETFVVDHFRDKWGAPLIFFVLGLLILLPWSVFAFDLERFIRARLSVFAPLIFLMAGVVCSALALTLAVKALRFRRRAVKAVGVIVESKNPRGPGESDGWAITVEFADEAGSQRRGTATVSKVAWRRAYQVGDQQPILYDPEHPWEIQADTFLERFVGPLILAALGAGCITAGVAVWIFGIS